MKIHEQRMINISDIKPYANNARTHSTQQIEQIVKSIKEFGFTNPLLIDNDYNLIAGHGRLEAIRWLNNFDYKDKPITQLPAVIVSDLSDTQRRALVIADNKIALNAGWDLDILKDELELLENENYDMDLLGFSDSELSEILDSVRDDDNFLKENDSGWDKQALNGSLCDRYIEPPFSVINLRSQKSIDMSNKWRDIGIMVGGRGENNGTFYSLNSLLKKNIWRMQGF